MSIIINYKDISENWPDVDAYDEYYSKIEKQLPNDFLKKLDMHDAQLLNHGFDGKDYIMDFDPEGSFTSTDQLKFYNAIILRKDALLSKNERIVWDYFEVYPIESGYEIRILFHGESERNGYLFLNCINLEIYEDNHGFTIDQSDPFDSQIHFLCKHGFKDQDYFLTSCLNEGENINKRNGFQYTPLMSYCSRACHKNKDIHGLKLLLENGADRTLKDCDGKTAYDHAIENGYPEFAELLKI